MNEGNGGGDCPVAGGIAVSLLLLGAFGSPLFILGIAGCLLGALIAYLFRSKPPTDIP